MTDEDTRTLPERRADVLAWARNEATTMAAAHASGQGLALSPASCEAFAANLQSATHVIEDHAPPEPDTPVDDLERRLSNAVNEALSWDHGHTPEERFRPQLSAMVVQALHEAGYQVTPPDPTVLPEGVDPEVAAINRCVAVLLPLAGTQAAGDVAAYLHSRFHGGRFGCPA